MCRVDGRVIVKPCSAGAALCEEMWGSSSQCVTSQRSARLHKRVQGVHGVYGGRGLGALVALARVPAGALPAILPDKRAILVELPVSSFPVVN